MVYNHAAAYLDAHVAGRVLPLPLVGLVPFRAAHEMVKRLAVKPLSKGVGVIPSVTGPDDGSWRVAVPEIHFDGSYTAATDTADALAGLGAVLALPDAIQPHEYCAPVVLNPTERCFPRSHTTPTT